MAFATPRSPILTLWSASKNTLRAFMSRWRIFLRCRSRSPAIIWMENFQILSSLRDFPIWAFKKAARSPFGQYSMTMWRLDFTIKVLKCLTMYGEFIYCKILPSSIAWNRIQIYILPELCIHLRNVHNFQHHNIIRFSVSGFVDNPKGPCSEFP